MSSFHFYNRIRLAVISEPKPTSQDQECEDIGYAFVNINDIIERKENFLDQELPRKRHLFLLSSFFLLILIITQQQQQQQQKLVFDANDERQMIGKMVVTVEIIEALDAIKRELNRSMRDTN